MMKRSVILTGILLMLVNIALAQEKPDRVIEYKAVGDVKVSLHIFNPTDLKTTDKRPAILFFFGGGWVGGSPSQFDNQSRNLASLGYLKGEPTLQDE